MDVKRVSIGDLSFQVNHPSIGPALGCHDLDDNGALDEADAKLSGNLGPHQGEWEANEWVAQRYRSALIEVGIEDPSLDMMMDAACAYRAIKPVSDMIDGLRDLPHEDAYWLGVEHRYDSQTWARGVLPLIGGNTDEYRAQIEGASNTFKQFAEEHDLLSNVLFGSGTGRGPYGVDHSIVHLERVPESFRPAIVSLTQAMSNIVDWQRSEAGGRHSQIECDGAGCPSDDEADAFPTDFRSKLCYVTEERGDATCYDHVYNPHVDVTCIAVYCLVSDMRSGEVFSAWRWGDSLKEAMGYRSKGSN